MFAERTGPQSAAFALRRIPDIGITKSINGYPPTQVECLTGTEGYRQRGVSSTVLQVHSVWRNRTMENVREVLGGNRHEPSVCRVNK